MCGVVAFQSSNPPDESAHVALSKAMDSMHKRGPDGASTWADQSILLGHRRLAIIDLAPKSTQPMVSPCGRYRIVFNGEIYNYRELRAELTKQGINFATESDTEVIVALYSQYGERMLPLLRGMFAFVIWDSHEQQGFAARDPYGIKPLYYALTSEGIWFASQVKALLATGRVSRVPCSKGQSGFWLTGSVPEPYTWFDSIKALPAGHAAYFNNGRLQGTPICWWDIAADFAGTAASSILDIQVEVREALLDSMRCHLVADVPVGVFLSGGIDSGSLAGMMVELGYRDLHGVTIGFGEFEGQHQNEVPFAAQIAARYGIRHNVRWVTKSEFAADLPKIIDAMDQPSIDGVNTWYASKAVAELGLKVVVSGVGGDELFQGYSTFSRVPAMHQAVSAINRIPGMNVLFRQICRLQAKRSGNARWLDMPAMAGTLPGAWLLSRGLFSTGELPAVMGDLAGAGLSALDWISDAGGSLPADPRLAMAQMESVFYLRNQLLRDSDWASMAHGVELRTPLVDAHLLRRLAPHLANFRQYPNKSLLSGSVRPALPVTVTHRTKTGFGIPMDRWLSQELASKGGQSRQWANRLASQYGLDLSS
jgi:asparagine synthase (glutamine-hydrolysing)